MQITFHLTPKAYFEAFDPAADYVPEAFAQEGFIHCTDDPEEMGRVANRFYADRREPQLYLYIDKERVKAPVRYDDPGRLYPHIYGPLNREAIVAVRPAGRGANGEFVRPEEEFGIWNRDEWTEMLRLPGEETL